MTNTDIDFGLYDAIEDLLGDGELEAGTPAYGVAQQVIHEGYDSLTPAQQHVYDKYVAPLLERRETRIRTDEILMSNPD